MASVCVWTHMQKENAHAHTSIPQHMHTARTCHAPSEYRHWRGEAPWGLPRHLYITHRRRELCDALFVCVHTRIIWHAIPPAVTLLRSARRTKTQWKVRRPNETVPAWSEHSLRCSGNLPLVNRAILCALVCGVRAKNLSRALTRITRFQSACGAALGERTSFYLPLLPWCCGQAGVTPGSCWFVRRILWIARSTRRYGISCLSPTFIMCSAYLHSFLLSPLFDWCTF